MDGGDEPGVDVSGLRPQVAELETTARETRARLRAELLAGDHWADADTAAVADLRTRVDATRRVLRQVDQYVVALEDQADSE